MTRMSLKVIGREASLRTKSPFGLLKDLGPKMCPNILWKEESKKINDYMKVEDGGVHCKK